MANGSGVAVGSGCGKSRGVKVAGREGIRVYRGRREKLYSVHSLYIPAFKLVPPHKLFHGFPISLLNDVDFHRIFDAFFPLEAFGFLESQINGSVSSHTHGWDRSSSMLDFCFFGFDFHCPPALPSLSNSAFVLREYSLL
nr:hypothetical protein [Tanacetum cinerariifolium]